MEGLVYWERLRILLYVPPVHRSCISSRDLPGQPRYYRHFAVRNPTLHYGELHSDLRTWRILRSYGLHCRRYRVLSAPTPLGGSILRLPAFAILYFTCGSSALCDIQFMHMMSSRAACSTLLACFLRLPCFSATSTLFFLHLHPSFFHIPVLLTTASSYFILTF